MVNCRERKRRRKAMQAAMRKREQAAALDLRDCLLTGTRAVSETNGSVSDSLSPGTEVGDGIRRGRVLSRWPGST